ncbi:MAG: PAS domain-containing sensor histidine kinase [Desulfuromonadia bacterium]
MRSTSNPRSPIRITLFTKIFVALLFVSLIPLLTVALLQSRGLVATSERLLAEITRSIDRQAAASLEMQAQRIAGEVASLLKGCEEDLDLARRLAGSPTLLETLYRSRKETLLRRGRSGEPPEVRETIPRYWSLEVIGRDGRQIWAIEGGRVLSPGELRDLSRPGQTRFPGEEYLRKGFSLPPGGVWVSHLTGFHLEKREQLRGKSDPEDAVDGKVYEGVIRFVTRSEEGDRLVVLSLDHRVLMEFTQHVLPGTRETVIFPSYKSGNYAFVFDDEGWIITHPKFWDIRGVDRQGRLVPPYRADSSPEDLDRGRIPFNLDHAGFVHPNYPVVAAAVRRGESGHLPVTNVGGAEKVMAYAAIPYATGDYQRYGIFGGITIGAGLERFHEPAAVASRIIGLHLSRFHRISLVSSLLALILVGVAAFFVSRGITTPLRRLTLGAQRLERGEESMPVRVSAGDEVGELADSFNRMAEELHRQREGLLETLRRLDLSRQEIVAERNFKDSILESISSGILTFTPDGRLSSINGTGRRIIGGECAPGTLFRDLLEGFGDIAAELGESLAGRGSFGRRSRRLIRDGVEKHYDVGLFPIPSEGGGGVTLTIRDETERERLRAEMMRLDRLASLGKLSAGIAHEVRNPLTGVSLLLDDLHDRMASHPDDAQLIVRALSEIERVERLITSLLTYAAPPAPSFVLGDLNGAIREVILFFRKGLEGAGIGLVTTLDPLPPVSFDRDAMRQVFINLLKNAQEALTRGGTIVISSRHRDQEVVVTICDDGPGIDPEDIPVVFEPFFTRKGAGTGLGLSITQRIVEEHGGTISVVSAAGEGTCFEIRLPVGKG